MKTKYLLVITFIMAVFNGLAQKSIFDDRNMSVVPLDINTPNSDFGPAIIDNELIFSSFSDDAGRAKNHNKTFYDLYASGLDKNGNVSSGRKRLSGVTTQYHEGPLSYCAKTGELFMTQSEWDNPEEVNMVFKKKNIRLGIVVYEKKGSEWQFKEKFPFNSFEYSVAHPAVSQTGDTLIFASDMPGGQGMTDLFYTVRKDGKWSDPINLGPKVNSPAKEVFPFLNSDGSLVFSSDGHGGSGNLDLFYISFPINGESQLKSFGGEINSPADDFGLVIHPNQQAGYFSSNRKGGTGDDDIYFLKMDDFMFDVIALSNFTKRGLAGANISVSDEAGNIAATGRTNEEGKLSVKLPVDKKYSLVATVENYIEKVVELDFTIAANLQPEQEILLDPQFMLQGQVVDILGNIPIPDALVAINDGSKTDSIYADYEGGFSYHIAPGKSYQVYISAYNFFGTDLEFNTADMRPGVVDYLIQLYSLDAGSRIELKNIYYDLASWEIRPDAAKELDRLVSALKEYPDLQIRLESHTDSRGSDEFNLELSEKRSNAALDYLISKGIDADRLEHAGLGESQLVNKCDDGVDCTEEEHARNRRTVVEILKAKVTRRSKGNIFYF